jgi:hypothetical protein
MLELKRQNVSALKEDEGGEQENAEMAAPSGADNARPPCSTVLLTTFITGKVDPQRQTYQKPSFEYMSAYYESILAHNDERVRAVILHDQLPQSLVDEYTPADQQVSFVMVNISKYPDLGVNDLRYHLFQEQLLAHPEWDVVFATDLHDVTVRRNPCDVVYEQGRNKLFVGSEAEELAGHEWMRDNEFALMGGQYLSWFLALPQDGTPVYNAGLQGGTRDTLLKLVTNMIQVIDDPALQLRQQHEQVHINMGALNWVLRTKYNATDLWSGTPLNSKFKAYEDGRDDVAFVHKF